MFQVGARWRRLWLEGKVLPARLLLHLLHLTRILLASLTIEQVSFEPQAFFALHLGGKSPIAVLTLGIKELPCEHQGG